MITTVVTLIVVIIIIHRRRRRPRIHQHNLIRHYRGIDAISDQATLALTACTVAVVSAHMPLKLSKSTSDDSHLAGDSEQSENKDFAGMAARVTGDTSDDTHLADDSKRRENAAGCSGYAPPVQEECRMTEDTSVDAHHAGNAITAAVHTLLQ